MNPLAFDTHLFRAVNDGFRSRILDSFFSAITNIGTGEFLIFVALLLLLNRKSFGMSGVILLAGMTLSFYTVGALKHAIARPRPFMALPDVHLLTRASDYSCPSGHTTFAFMAAFIIASYYKKGAVVPLAAYGIASLIGYSRIYLGAHYPIDVLYGIVLGSAIGYLLVQVTKKAVKGA